MMAVIFEKLVANSAYF